MCARSQRPTLDVARSRPNDRRRLVTARRTDDGDRDVPEATVARLPLYLRALTEIAAHGVR